MALQNFVISSLIDKSLVRYVLLGTVNAIQVELEILDTGRANCLICLRPAPLG